MEARPGEYRQTTVEVGSFEPNGCGTPSMTKRSKYPETAYQLGRSL
ncbi:MAG: hypothetical protein IJI25_00555 [Eubacterium sp.]|nr:hypothetical protein [Eubacterium sp.]